MLSNGQLKITMIICECVNILARTFAMHTFVFMYISVHVRVRENALVWLGWIGFYDLSTIVGYLMPTLLYTCILNI